MSGTSKALEFTRKTVQLLSNTKGFNRLLQKVQVVDATPGTVKAQFTVAEEDVNSHGMLHGACTAFMVDMITTVALTNSQPEKVYRPGVSVDLSVSYMKAAKLGETITMDATTLKKGSKLSFSTVDFRNSAGQLIAQGKHTKFLDVNSPGTRS